MTFQSRDAQRGEQREGFLARVNTAYTTSQAADAMWRALLPSSVASEQVASEQVASEEILTAQRKG